MKSLLKWILILTTAIIFLYAFSASYNSQNIDHLDYVIAIAVDSIPDSNNLEVSFEFANISSFSEGSSSKENKPIIDTVSAPSISSAINIMNAYVGKQLNLAHCKVVVFSDELAKKGILSEITFLMNDTQVRPTTNVIVAMNSAKDYIENSTSTLEQVLTKYYDIFPTSSEYTGYTSNILLGEFYEGLINKDSGCVTILGKKSKSATENSQNSAEGSSSEENSSDNGMNGNSSSENTQSSNKPTNSTNQQTNSTNQQTNSTNENNAGDSHTIDTTPPEESIIKGDRNTENIGLCVFKDDVYVGNLSAIETLCYSLLENEVDNFVISVDNPLVENQKVDLSVSRLSSSSFTIDTSQENPVITINLVLMAKALTGQEQLDYSQTETLKQLNESLKSYLSSQMSNYLNKTSKEYKCDINGFYRTAKRNFTTISDYKNYNWEQKYQNAKFNININSNIRSSLLIQNS